MPIAISSFINTTNAAIPLTDEPGKIPGVSFVVADNAALAAVPTASLRSGQILRVAANAGTAAEYKRWTGSAFVDYSFPSSAGGSVSPYVAYTTNDWDDVLQAFQDLESTGGTIVLPPGYIDVDRQITPLTGYSQGLIPVAHGIHYVGAGSAWSAAGVFDVSKSTILRNTTGTRQPMVAWNAIDKATPYATWPEMLAKWLLNFRMSSLVIQGGDYGIKIGAFREAGARNCRFDDVFCWDNSEQGMWFENTEDVEVDRAYCYNNRHGFAYVASGGALWNFGNSSVRRLKTHGTRPLAGIRKNGRGFAILARGASQINDVYCHDLGGGGEGDIDLSTVTLTLTSGVPDIGVPDLSIFEPGMLVIPNATFGGFNTNTMRVVSSVSGTSGAGTIRLCNSLGGLTASGGNGGTVITPSATGSLSVTVRGFAPNECGGLDFGSELAGCGIVGRVDCENGGSCCIFVHDARGFQLDTNVLSTVSSNFPVMFRNNRAQVLQWTNRSGNTGFDSDNAPTYSGGDNSFTTISRSVGVKRHPTNARGVLHLGISSAGTDLYNDVTDCARWGATQVLHTTQRNFVANETVAIPYTGGNVSVLTGTGGTVRLPAVVNANVTGIFHYLTNATANSFTINDNGGQLIYSGGVGAASFTLGPRETAVMIGGWDGTAGAWYRVG